MYKDSTHVMINSEYTKGQDRARVKFCGAGGKGANKIHSQELTKFNLCKSAGVCEGILDRQFQ